jgi:hypothetical protein
MAVLKHAGIANIAVDIEGTQEVLDSIGRNAGLLKWLERVDVTQGDSVMVQGITTTNSSAGVHVEDDAVTAQAPTITQGSFDLHEFSAAFGITGSALRRAGIHGDMIVRENRDDALAALVSYMEGYHCSAKATYSIIGQIDDDTTAWGGVNRAVTTALKSNVVPGGSATMTLAELYNATEGMCDPPFIAKAPELMMSSITQLRVYKTSIMAEPVPGQGGGLANTGYRSGPAAFGEIPWVPVQGMLNTVVLALSGVRGTTQGRVLHRWYNWQPQKYLEQYGANCVTIPLRVGMDQYEIGNLALVTLGPSDDSTAVLAITGGAYVCRGPAGQSLIEALATS